MKCPACKASINNEAWICPKCDHILDPSVLEAPPEGAPGEGPIREERTKLIAWPRPEQEDSVPDAVILGNVNVAEGEFAVVHGAGAGEGGRTSTFLYYAAGSTTRVVHPDAVPRLSEADTTLPRTPYEDFILSCIDGRRTVREIQKTSGLAPQEVAVTLLTLLDKNAVVIVGPNGHEGATRRPQRERRRRESLRAASPTPAKRQAARPGPAPASARRPSPLPIFPKEPDDDNELLQTQSLDRAAVVARNPEVQLPPDFDDLPSVSDYEDAEPSLEDSVTSEPRLPSTSARSPTPDWEETHALGEDPTVAPKKRLKSSLSDVWSESSVSADDAGGLIEREEPELDDADDRPLVQPSELDEGDAEEATAEVEIPDEPIRARAALQANLPPPSVTGAKGPAALGLPSAQSQKRSTPLPSLLEPSGPIALKAPSHPALLDPAFLEEVPPSLVTMAPANPLQSPEITGTPRIAPVGKSTTQVDDEATKEAKKRALAAAVKRGPIQEKLSGVSRLEKRGPDTVPPEPLRKVEPEPARPSEAKDGPKSDPREKPLKNAEPVDNARMLKAQKLFEQALKDKADGNLVSARMNMKLALTFDPSNPLYNQAFQDLSKNPDAKPKGIGSGALEKARELYNAATEAENGGNVDRAIELLERAIEESKQAAFYNRLGVILAMKKHSFVRAQELIERAIELAPGNTAYEKNLQKILSMAATISVNKDQSGGKKGGILGFLGRKK